MSLNSLGSLLFGDHRSRTIGRIGMSHFGWSLGLCAIISTTKCLRVLELWVPFPFLDVLMFFCILLHDLIDSEILHVDFIHLSLKIFCTAGKVGSNYFIYQVDWIWLILRMEQCWFHHIDRSRWRRCSSRLGSAQPSFHLTKGPGSCTPSL